MYIQHCLWMLSHQNMHSTMSRLGSGSHIVKDIQLNSLLIEQNLPLVCVRCSFFCFLSRAEDAVNVCEHSLHRVFKKDNSRSSSSFIVTATTYSQHEKIIYWTRRFCLRSCETDSNIYSYSLLHTKDDGMFHKLKLSFIIHIHWTVLFVTQILTGTSNT